MVKYSVVKCDTLGSDFRGQHKELFEVRVSRGFVSANCFRENLQLINC